MKRRDGRLFIGEMISACEDIAGALDGVDEAAFLADRLRQKAVIRDLEVLGEACRNVPEDWRHLANGIPWRIIVAMRNRLIHEYFGVDLGIVYRTATQDIPPLLPQLRSLLANIDADRADG